MEIYGKIYITAKGTGLENKLKREENAMKIWEILKVENLNKRYRVKIYGVEQEVIVAYEGNSNYLTVKKETYPFYPLNSFYLGAILDLEFKEVKYRKLDFYYGGIENFVHLLLKHKEKDELVYADFNGHRFYSDKITMDGAYMELTGKTKAEFDAMIKEQHEAWEKQRREHKASIPEKTEYWRAKGKEILSIDKWEYWDKIVPIRLEDLYEGMELECCLDLVALLKEGAFEEAKEMLNNQGHSGMSYGLVCTMLKEFADNGEEFLEFIGR